MKHSSNRRIKIVAALLVPIAIAVAPASAEAKWGPGAGCGISDEPLLHCYALAWRSTNDLGTVLYADASNVNVPEWQNGSFVSQEQWVSFSGKPKAWIEMGQLEGYAMDCCTVHPFFAEETPDKRWHIRIAEGSGPNQYAHYRLFDAEANGIWRMYWGSANGEWVEEERYGGWGTTRFQEEEAGSEAADETAPLDVGKDQVARIVNSATPWYPWSNSTLETVVPHSFCLYRNVDNPAEGNIEWSAGTC